MLHLLTSISSVRLYIPKDLRPFDNRQLMLKSIQVRKAAILDQRTGTTETMIFSFPTNISSAGGAETFPRRRSSARPSRWHGHQRPCAEKSDSESGGLWAPHVLSPPAQWPQLGICLFPLWEESSGEKNRINVKPFWLTHLTRNHSRVLALWKY